jgi:hypothetical protein
MSITRRDLITRGTLAAGIAGAIHTGRASAHAASSFAVSIGLTGLYGLATDKRGAGLGAVDALLVNTDKTEHVKQWPHTPRLIVPEDCIDILDIQGHGAYDRDRRHYTWDLLNYEVAFVAGSLLSRQTKAVAQLQPPTERNFKYCPTEDEWRDSVWLIDFQHIYGNGRPKVKPEMRTGYKPDTVLASRVALPGGYLLCGPPSQGAWRMTRWGWYVDKLKGGPVAPTLLTYRQLFTDSVMLQSRPALGWAVELWKFETAGKPAAPAARIWLTPSALSGLAQVYVETNETTMGGGMNTDSHVMGLYELIGDPNHAAGKTGTFKCLTDTAAAEPPIYCPPALL